MYLLEIDKHQKIRLFLPHSWLLNTYLLTAIQYNQIFVHEDERRDIPNQKYK